MKKHAFQIQNEKTGIALIQLVFDFDRKLIEQVKTLQYRLWHPNKRYWTCALSKENIHAIHVMGFTLDEKLQKFLEFKTLDKQAVESIEAITSISGLNGTLREYQGQGVAFIDYMKGRALIADEQGLGKEQPLYCKILTPSGWKKMGEIKVGEYIIGSSGKPIKVTGVFPQGEKDVYEIIFTDGSRTECGLEHLWNVRDMNRRYKKLPFVTKSTKELLQMGLVYSNGRYKWDIPIIKPVQFEKKNYFIHPYLLGVLLGDGYLCGTSIAYSNPKKDNDITEKIKTILPENCSFSEDARKNKTHCPQHVIKGITHKKSPILNEIRYLKLNVKSMEKFIPTIYKIGSIQQRKDLLYGLMDTDGTVTQKHTAVFCSYSKQLAEDVMELVRSLGGVCHIQQYKKEYRVSIHTVFCPFLTKRKKEKWKPSTKGIGNSGGRKGRFIKAINFIGKTEQQCISVDAKDKLYTTDDFIITHNTIQALAYLQLHPYLRPVLVVTPGVVKYKWVRETQKWLSNPGSIQILSGKTPNEHLYGNIVFINYDILDGWKKVLSAYGFKVMITDEVQYYKNNTAKRTKAVKMLGKHIPTLIGLSGTPIENRPVEIYNFVNLARPDLFPNFMLFAKKYCAAKHNRWGWDFSGASNIPELHKLLSENVMIRRLKKDVLKELPEIQYSYVPVELDNEKDYRDAQRDFISYIRLTKGAGSAARASNAETLVRLATLKKLSAIGKLPNIIKWIEEFFETKDKLVVAAWHQEVINVIVEHFGNIALKIDGTTPVDQRDVISQKFQNDPAFKLIVVNMKAGGVGIDLFAAEDIAVVELPWTPGILDQVIARIHRIGQKGSAMAHYLLGIGTIDESLAELIDKKRNVISQVMDGVEAESDELITELINKLTA